MNDVFFVHKMAAHVQNCSKLTVCFPVPSISRITYIATHKANTEEFKKPEIPPGPVFRKLSTDVRLV